MSEMRFDPVGKSWVIIAPDRGQRPTDFAPAARELSDEPCPFCLVRTGDEPATVVERRVVGDDSLMVLANRFPALRIESQLRRRAVGPYDHVGGVGAHEVVVETEGHGVPFSALPSTQVQALLLLWRDRIADLMRDRRLHYVTVFKNEGPRAGASLSHAHSQIIATPVRPTRLADELAATRRHFFAKERCLFCDVVDFEIERGDRVIEATDHFVAFCPYASRHPFEVQIYPRRHGHDFTAASASDLADLAGLLRRVVRRLTRALRGADYNLGLHTAPSPGTIARAHHDIDGMDLFWHWRLEVVPRLVTFGGFEVTADVHINPVSPEDAAAHLRAIDLG